MLTDIDIYIGDLIEYESERQTLDRLLEVLRTQNLPAMVFANISLCSRQIDFVLITEKLVLVIEAKG